jgi:pyruvate/2-oxoglutarate dehydrogenase complex dihydrolipoamide dehydrogenase (E3) component
MADHVVVVGGGPGGYEAALVAAQLGAEVTVVDTDGIGGSAVLTDCVPSKTLIATAELMTDVAGANELGVMIGEDGVRVDLGRVNQRVKTLAQAQSSDIEQRLEKEGVQLVQGRGSLAGPDRVVVERPDGREEILRAHAILVATGAAPRTLPTAQPDGERILTWEQVYDLHEVPSSLIVVGSGVTGAEFASGYLALGIPVTLVSSRDRVLPGEDADAAAVLEDVLTRRGMTVLSRSRMESVTRSGDVVTVTLTDGRAVEGSHSSSRSARCRTPPTSAWRRRGSPSTTAASSPSTGSRAPRRAGSTPPATAPACSCWPRWRRCRAGSRCGTSWATP